MGRWRKSLILAAIGVVTLGAGCTGPVEDVQRANEKIDQAKNVSDDLKTLSDDLQILFGEEEKTGAPTDAPPSGDPPQP